MVLKYVVKLLCLFVTYWSKDIWPTGSMPEVLLTSGEKIITGQGHY